MFVLLYLLILGNMILDYALQLPMCYIEKCKNEMKEMKIIKDKWLKNINNIYEDYINGKITNDKFIREINKLDEEYYKSIQINKMHTCEINKCNKFVKKHLDYIAAKNNYPIKSNYTVDDYINITRSNNKHFNNLELFRCHNENCKRNIEENKKARIQYLKHSYKIYDDYINGKITRQLFITKLNNLDEEYYKSIEMIRMHTCEINKCYKFVKKELDYMAATIDYPIKNKYTIDDYINIMLKYNKPKN